jgi:hypothetical protein
VRKLGNSVNGASNVVADLLALAGNCRTALKSVTVPHQDLLDSIKALETRLEDLQVLLTGDRRLFLWRLSEETRPAIAVRIDGIISGQSRSTLAPTQTQRDAYAIAEEEFKPVYEELKKILAEDVKAIEKRLDAVGAPYTPGRLPDWK